MCERKQDRKIATLRFVFVALCTYVHTYAVAKSTCSSAVVGEGSCCRGICAYMLRNPTSAKMYFVLMHLIVSVHFVRGECV